MDRRTFIKLGGLTLSAVSFTACNPFADKHTYKTRIAGSNSKTGHLLREKKFPAPSQTESLNTLIVGGGIAGLSAARWLKKNNYRDFKLFELDTEAGGNSKAAKNEISAYPFAAHYLPIANENYKELIEFLHEHKVITGFDENGLPVYNEYYICFEPHERFWFRGVWQDSLPPKVGLSEQEEKELIRFLATTEHYKNTIGSDGLPAFNIPLERSSKDKTFMALDELTIAEYLKRENYSSDFLLWYINYCCKDDFGTSIQETSAWAAFHYFACRNGKASNAASIDVLTWPEGNNFLSKKLELNLDSHIFKQQLTYKVENVNDRWHCHVYDVVKRTSTLYICEQVIMATPQFVNKNILAFETGIDWTSFSYYPWIVANISLKNKKELNGSLETAWDNVFYNSESLGYVNACHQQFDGQSNNTVITFYHNFSEKTARAEREKIYSKDENHWKEFILTELKKVHPHIEELITDIEVNVIGHGMISPVKNFRTNPSRAILEKGFKNLFFAHSDMSGISIFEQAFHRGITAANQVLGKKDGSLS